MDITNHGISAISTAHRHGFDPSAVSNHSLRQAPHTCFVGAQGQYTVYLLHMVYIFHGLVDACLETNFYWVGTSVPYAGTKPSCVFLYFIIR